MAVVKLGSKEINLDENLLKFDEHTINQFLQNFAAHYNLYQEAHADSTYLQNRLEDRYDSLYAEKFRQYREEVSSDKMAEMRTKADKEIQESLESVRIAKRNAGMIWGYLRSMDRAHANCLQMCYNMRKELDKLYDNVKISG